MERSYIAIDLKSFYASVECRERGLDPLDTYLVVADESRTEKTICLAVSPALKSWGIPGRPRLFQVVQKVGEVNRNRKSRAPGGSLAGTSVSHKEVAGDASLGVEYIAAPPRMRLYMDYSTRIYRIYLRFVSEEDIHVYSVDEVFIDVTDYLHIYRATPHELALRMIRAVLAETGITATAGIGTNMYLAKIAMDITAKHMEADKDGVRIAELDEMSYRKTLWNHRPLTDFWRIGRGYAKKLERHGLYTMGDIARCSVGNENDYYNEELLYRLFGVNAELLIDHAWGWEPCTIADIRAYRPESSSVTAGQVLKEPYDYQKARLVLKEMTDSLALDLASKGLTADQVVLTVGYDILNLQDPELLKKVKIPTETDFYGREMPKRAHGSENLGRRTSSGQMLMAAMLRLYDRIVEKDLLIRRMYVAANHVEPAEKERAADSETKKPLYEQLDMFTDYEALERQKKEEEEKLAREERMQKAVLEIQKKFGKNAVLRGMNLQEGATAIERNGQVGGHKG
ncbi:MAG: DNA methylase [Clostridium sp.]|nr:DNA methylase [Clostridium sp.]